MANYDIPRAFLTPSRSAFAVIDPVTEQYYRILDRGGAAQLSPSRRSGNYFAISYVWSEWKDSPGDKLPSWTQIRERLLQLSTTSLVTAYNKPPIDLAGNIPFIFLQPDPFRCWLDSKCINQSLQADKAYWIPRMNEVYFDARCTILLLKDLDLTALYELYKITTCLVSETSDEGSPKGGPNSHRCLFTPNCISLKSHIPPELEDVCLMTLEALWYGSWRKRAWIFQEILLSARYMLSWGDSSSVAYMDLGTVGYIAAFLHQRHPSKAWLNDFWTWCKQCQCLREFYSDKCDMEATILQLAQDLESTVPCDKYYALCGILGLTEVGYDAEHTAEEALSNVIAALTRHGRLGWMYAIPAGIGSSGIALSDQCMAPFVLTRKKRQTSAGVTRESFATENLIGLTGVEVGFICEVHLLQHVLQTMAGRYGHILDEGMDEVSFHELFLSTHILEKQIPGILFRLGYDTMNPFREESLFRLLCGALGISQSPSAEDETECLWKVVIKLCFLDTRVFACSNPLAEQLIETSARSIQSLCQNLITHNWSVITWYKCTEDDSSDHLPRFSLVQDYDHHSPMERRIWSVQSQRSSESVMFLAGFQDRDSGVKHYAGNTNLSEANASFYGMALQIPCPSSLAQSSAATYHDDPAENQNDVMQQFIRDFRSTLDTVSKTFSEGWKKRVKFMLFPRRRPAASPRPGSSSLSSDSGSRGLTSPLFQRWSSLSPGQYRPPLINQSHVTVDQIDSLHAMFPSLERDLLYNILVMHDRQIEASIEACLDLCAENDSPVANIPESQPRGLGLSLTLNLSSQDSSLDAQSTTPHSHDSSVSISSSTTTLEEEKIGSSFKDNNPYKAIVTTRQHSSP